MRLPERLNPRVDRLAPDSFGACLMKSVERLGPALTPQAQEQLLSGLACRKDCQLLSLPGMGPWQG